jgi:hypothetical protein
LRTPKPKTVRWHLTLDKELLPGCEKQSNEIFKPKIINLIIGFFGLLSLLDLYVYRREPWIVVLLIVSKLLGGITIKIGHKCLPNHQVKFTMLAYTFLGLSQALLTYFYE